MYSRRQKTLTRYGQASPPTQQPFVFPASVGGVNAISSLMQMPPQDCIYTYNLMPSEYGLRLRKGYQEWVINCKEDPARGSNQDVRTIIPFESNIQDAANDRLFAVTSEGIWNATVFGNAAPGQEAVFSITDNESGFGVWTEFTGDAAGDGLRGHYLFYADESNGIWQYTEEDDAWTQPPSGATESDWHYVDPVDGTTLVAFPVEDVAFVMVFKQRIWVILEDDDDAWYLPLASVTGELKKFTFGSKLPHGGNLVGLWSWSIDGGDGVDDYMVAISRGGDVVIYQGEDPEITPDGTSQGPWSTRGTWFIGELPNSRRVVGEYGPDLFMLSTYGLSSLADLLKGTPLDAQSPSKKVNRFLRADVERGKDSSTWQVVVHPADGFMQIVTPKPFSTPYVQYNMNLQTGSWGFWRDVPVLGGDTWNGDYFMAGPDGTVYVNDGELDNTQLNATNQFQNVPVGIPGPEWSVLNDEYTCDGTQIAETEYLVTALAPLVIGTRYEVIYQIKDHEQGQHRMTIQGQEIMPASVGAGVFSVIFIPQTADDQIALVGSEDFQGTFYNVSVREEREKGEPIKFSTLTSFQAPHGHTDYCRVGFIRSVGILKGTAAINANAVYDYRIEAQAPYPTDFLQDKAGIWDSSLWDEGIWDYELKGASYTSGALGMGRTFAISAVGSSTTRITVVAWDVSFTKGGFL